MSSFEVTVAESNSCRSHRGMTTMSLNAAGREFVERTLYSAIPLATFDATTTIRADELDDRALEVLVGFSPQDYLDGSNDERRAMLHGMLDRNLDMLDS